MKSEGNWLHTDSLDGGCCFQPILPQNGHIMNVFFLTFIIFTAVFDGAKMCFPAAAISTVQSLASYTRTSAASLNLGLA